MIKNNKPIDFILQLADTNLLLSQRNSEWCGHGPALEQDIAISNIALDLLGQARNYYQYAAQLMDNSITEDDLAYIRNSEDFLNLTMVELPRGDWAFTILRQYYCSIFQKFLQQQLLTCTDEQVKAIAAKNLKEITYHLRWSKDWVLRLGDGTEESKQKMVNAIADLNDYISEFFEATDYEINIFEDNFSIDFIALKRQWFYEVNETLHEAGLTNIELSNNISNGKKGLHSPFLKETLAEMQGLHREHQNVSW